MLYAYIDNIKDNYDYKCDKHYNLQTKIYTLDELRSMIIEESNKSFMNFVMFFNENNYMSLLRDLFSLSAKNNKDIYVKVIQ